jgi:hypothetical protein
MTQFHEGQEVEVTQSFDCGVAIYGWRKAKIEGMHGDKYLVKFNDGTYADSEMDHIRAAKDWRQSTVSSY